MTKELLPAIIVCIVLVCGFVWLMLVGRSTNEVPQDVAMVEDQPEDLREVQTPTISYQNASGDDIVVELPFPGAVTGKEFGVIGKARGYWFFEASFPIEIRDVNNALLASGIATAEGDWMTTDFVTFTAQLTTPQNYIGPATLILKKDNPSGEPQNDGSISFPITIEY
jgi:hypothetical protein